MTADKIFGIAGPIGLITMIVGVVAGGITFMLAHQASVLREEIRKLKMALERDPAPAHLAQALKYWPEASRYPETQQLVEFRKQAQREESTRADRFEQLKGMMRFFLFAAFLGGAVFIASLFFGKASDRTPSTPPAVEANQ